MSSGRADRPTAGGGEQYHLHVSDGSMPPMVLLPGDPFRVPTLAAAWDEREEVAHHREYRSMRGRFRAVPIGACSTGIGGPSSEIAVVELAAVGCHTFLRLGTTGGLQEQIRSGDIIISTSSIRWDGASEPYAPQAYPAAASYEVVLALIEACERLQLTYHLGVSAAIASFYAGQSRPSIKGYEGMEPGRVAQLQSMGVMNIEMESATIFTLASLFGLRAGAACVVIADRFRNEFQPEGAEEKLARLGAETVAILAGMDDTKRAAGKPWYFMGLRNAP